MLNATNLRQTLERMDGRGYKAYKDLRGSYAFDGWTLFIDHVQGDPYAAPTKVRLRVPQSRAQVPPETFANRTRRVACQDYLGRALRRAIRTLPDRRDGTGKSGSLFIDAGGQEVLERTACLICAEWVEVRLEIGLPAQGRRIAGRLAARLLCDDLPVLVERGLLWSNIAPDKGVAFIHSVENQEHMRGQLADRGLVAFVANDAILPRESGVSDRPMRGPRVVPFTAPSALELELGLLHPVHDGPEIRHTVTGMGIPRGVTLIVGGGYHGKSTLLEAIQRGVYPHVLGDGREGVVTLDDAVKIRAEDGRRVEQVDIRPFISNLPFAASTECFSSDDASGSTSQAANIMEALETGCRTLLVDEDTSATNFMVRDARMQALVHADDEPITPFIDRVRELYDQLGVSTLIVVGGSGDYFDVADTVISMKAYVPREVTHEARRIAAELPTRRSFEPRSPVVAPRPRIPVAESVAPRSADRRFKVSGFGVRGLRFGKQDLDLTALEQLVDASQTRAIGQAMLTCAHRLMGPDTCLGDVVEACLEALEAGLDPLAPFGRAGEHPGNFARFRRHELAAAINRLRTLRVR